MKFSKAVFDIYIESSIHVAFAVLALFQITVLDYNLSDNNDLTFFVFFGTIVGYNGLKYAEVFWRRMYTFRKNFNIVFVSAVSLLCALFFFQKLESNLQIQFFSIGLLVVFYPFIRKFWILKMVYVSFCLTFITVVIPLSKINFDGIYLFQRFLLVFCLLIPLEICNFPCDAKTITTMPKIIGIENLKRVGYVLLVIYCLTNYTSANLVISLILGIAIFHSNEGQSKYYSSFWMDVLPIFFYALICYLE